MSRIVDGVNLVFSMARNGGTVGVRLSLEPYTTQATLVRFVRICECAASYEVMMTPAYHRSAIELPHLGDHRYTSLEEEFFAQWDVRVAPASDEDFMRYIRDYDDKRLEMASYALVGKYTQKLYIFASRTLPSEDAVEVANWTLKRVLDQIENFEEGRLASPWIYGICRYRVLDILRRRHQDNRTFHLEDWTEMLANEQDDTLDRWAEWDIDQSGYDLDRFLKAYDEAMQLMPAQVRTLYEKEMGQGEWRRYEAADQQMWKIFHECYGDESVRVADRLIFMMNAADTVVRVLSLLPEATFTIMSEMYHGARSLREFADAREDVRSWDQMSDGQLLGHLQHPESPSFDTALEVLVARYAPAFYYSMRHMGFTKREVANGFPLLFVRIVRRCPAFKMDVDASMWLIEVSGRWAIARLQSLHGVPFSLETWKVMVADEMKRSGEYETCWQIGEIDYDPSLFWLAFAKTIRQITKQDWELLEDRAKNRAVEKRLLKLFQQNYVDPLEHEEVI